jgi:hypothetical protein
MICFCLFVETKLASIISFNGVCKGQIKGLFATPLVNLSTRQPVNPSTKNGVPPKEHPVYYYR